MLLYSRYYNAEGESRYLPEGTYKQVIQGLRQDFAVRVDNKPLTRESLAEVKLLLIANPSPKTSAFGSRDGLPRNFSRFWPPKSHRA